jgi:hypothetical protein
MTTTNGTFFLDLRFRDAMRSGQIVDCLEQNFIVIRVRGRNAGGDGWIRVEMGDVRKADALRRLGARHGFEVQVAA